MTYLLVDANHLASRCRFAAVNDLARSDGRSTGVLYGVLKGMSWARYELAVTPSRTIMFWDGGRASGRLEMYPGYKSGRRPAEPSDVEQRERKAYFDQIALAQQALRCLGIRQVQVWGAEADDLLAIHAATLAHLERVIVYSGDTDFHQLVSERVTVFNGNDLLDVRAVCDIWGVLFPRLVAFNKSVVGDSSDSIDGVPGIGAKRAGAIADYWFEVLGCGDQPESIADDVWVLVETIREHVDVVLRNLRLVMLPHDWSESFYDGDESLRMRQQLELGTAPRDLVRFAAFCREWELFSLLESTSSW